MKSVPIAILCLVSLSSCMSSPASLFRESLYAAISQEDSASDKAPDQGAGPAKSEAPKVQAAQAEDSIISAIERYDLAAVKRLVGSNPDVRTMVPPGTPLLVLAQDAAGYSDEENEVLNFLVARKAAVLQQDASGRNIGSAIWEQEVLLETPRGRQFEKLWNEPNQRRQAALGNDSVRDIEALKDALPIDSFLLLEAARRGAGAIVQFALAKGVSASVADPSSGDTPLHLLLFQGGHSRPFDQMLTPLTKLLEAGADVNGKNKAGHTPLYGLLATAAGDVYKRRGNPDALMALLLEKGAEYATLEYQGNSALYWAGNLELPRSYALMSSGGVDAALIDDPNATLMVIKDYLQKGGDPRRAIPRIQRGDAVEQRELIDLILAKGVTAREIDPDLATWNFENVRYLVERGASVQDSTILVRIIQDYKGLTEIRYLLDKGADMKFKYRGGLSILHYVASMPNGNVDMAALFLAAGADINARNDRGETPLDRVPAWASKNALRDYLISKGAVSGKP